MKGTGSHQGADTTPDYGRRLLPTLIDERARSNHSNPIASIPRTKNPQDGYVDISYARFANAINRCAPLAGRADGRSTTFENVAYMAATHIRYQILKIAAAKMGYVMFFFMFPRNSKEAFRSLLEEASIDGLIVTSQPMATIGTLFGLRPMSRLVIAELDGLLDETAVDRVPFEGTFEEYRMKPWVLLHTSGSTGTWPTAVDTRGCSTRFPPFHMAGLTIRVPLMQYPGDRVSKPL